MRSQNTAINPNQLSLFDHAATGEQAIDALLAEVQVEPRPYQRRIASKAIDMLEGRHTNRFGHQEPAARSVLIESPTGSGKTVMGLLTAKALQQRHGMRVGWVAMRRNLLAQAAAENVRRRFGLEMELISMFDKAPPEVDLLVVDEAQHDAAVSMGNLHSAIKPRMTLGLSATPFRTDRVKLCFEKVITDAGIHQLIQDGYLSRYHHYTIPAYTPESVAWFYLRDVERWGKTLLFFHRYDQCLKAQRLLAEAGVASEVVTSQTDRERQLNEFADGKFNVLINMAILTEGFDCPALKTVFCRPSGKGCTVQMGGRVFRKHPRLPFKQIVQCKETRHPFVKTALADEQYVWMEEDWRTLKLNEHLAAISHNSLRLIAASPVELPKFVTRNRAKPNRWQFRSATAV
jgi:superfamily II DNA or RNA helicase